MKETRIKLTEEQAKQLPLKTGMEKFYVKFIGMASSVPSEDYIEMVIFTEE